MTPEEQRIAGYYDALVDRFGHAPQAVDHASRESLEARYRVLAEVGDLRQKSILEVGCGFGGLGAFLSERISDIRYTGIDLSPRMIAEGRSTWPGLDLREGSLLDLPAEPAYDIVLAQGIFYLLRDDAEASVKQLVARMFALSRTAVAFCGLSRWAPAPNPDEYHLDPLPLLAWCRTLTPRVVLRHDYLPHDVCFYLYRP